jgi:cwf21 domain
VLRNKNTLESGNFIENFFFISNYSLSEEEIQKKVDSYRMKLMGISNQNGNDSKDDHGRPM